MLEKEEKKKERNATCTDIFHPSSFFPMLGRNDIFCFDIATPLSLSFPPITEQGTISLTTGAHTHTHTHTLRGTEGWVKPLGEKLL